MTEPTTPTTPTTAAATAFELDESLALARHEIEAKQFAPALQRLKALAQAEPPSAQAVLLLARLYGQLGLPQRAQAGFERYLALEPVAVHERFELGVALLEQDQAQAALGTWREVLEQVPDYPPALYFSAVAHSQMDAREQAEQFLQHLFQTTVADNLYHQRGQELLQRLIGPPTLAMPVPPEMARH